MSVEVEFLFDFGSPNAYLAHKTIPEITARSGILFRYVPVLLGGVFKATGNASPAITNQGILGKNEYGAREIMRFVHRHGIDTFTFNPFFPVNTLQVMRGAIAASDEGVYEPYIDAVFEHMWGAEPKKMDDPAVFAAALADSGLPSEAIVAGTQNDSVKKRLIENTDAAVARGVFGLPAFFVDEELYFGKETLREIEFDLEGAG